MCQLSAEIHRNGRTRLAQAKQGVKFKSFSQNLTRSFKLHPLFDQEYDKQSFLNERRFLSIPRFLENGEQPALDFLFLVATDRANSLVVPRFRK